MGALAIAARERSVQQRGCGGERRTRTDAHGARLRIAMCGPRCGMMRCLHGRTALQSGSAVYANGRTGLREQSTHDHRPNRSTHHDSNGKFDHARSLVLRLRLFGDHRGAESVPRCGGCKHANCRCRRSRERSLSCRSVRSVRRVYSDKRAVPHLAPGSGSTGQNGVDGVEHGGRDDACESDDHGRVGGAGRRRSGGR